MKDNFSTQSDKYAIYRPSYPKEVFTILYSHLNKYQRAWDCGTGNGQVAKILAEKFESVFATDISQSQIQYAPKETNIVYKVEQAENSSFENDFFDLILVAQAIHWFDFEAFYEEVFRTLKKDGIFVVLGYGKLRIDEEIDKLINYLYSYILRDYWDTERNYIDRNYQTIPFPFEEIKINQELFYHTQWGLNHLLGYLNTWSAVKHYVNKNQTNPVKMIENELRKCWKENQEKTVSFPILMRMGRIKK